MFVRVFFINQYRYQPDRYDALNSLASSGDIDLKLSVILEEHPPVEYQSAESPG